MFQNVRTLEMSSVCGSFVEGSYSTTNASAADDVSRSPNEAVFLDKNEKFVSFFLQTRTLPFLSFGGAEAAEAGVGILWTHM